MLNGNSPASIGISAVLLPLLVDGRPPQYLKPAIFVAVLLVVGFLSWKRSNGP